MNLQGDFEGLTLASIFQLLFNDQKTGVLTVACDTEENRVFFDQGTIIYATASLKETRLGFLMRTDGIISTQQLQKSLVQAKKEKLRLGKILVEKGYISHDTLIKYNTKQVEIILYNILFWEKGRFEYKDVKLNLEGMIVTQLNPMKLILEASRRIDELSVLKKSIPSDQLIFKMSGKVQSKDEIKLNPNEWHILSLIDGSRTVRQIINESGYDEFAVYKIFFSVISSGLIEQKKDALLDGDNKDNEESVGERGREYSVILSVFNDILTTIKKNISTELGNRSHALFEEIKLDLPIEFQTVLKDYHPDNHKNSNLQSICRGLNKLDALEDPKEFLIQGFIEYCTRMLKKVGGILGGHPLSKILKDIEKVLIFVKKYQADSKEKSKIVNLMKDVIARLQIEFKIDKKRRSKGGIFSFFSS